MPLCSSIQKAKELPVLRGVSPLATCTRQPSQSQPLNVGVDVLMVFEGGRGSKGRGVWGVGLGAWYLHRFDALHGVECPISQRLNVVVVKWEQTEAVQVAEGILAYAGDLVGIQQQQLQRAKSFEYARGQILYFIAIQHAVSEKTELKKTKQLKHKWKCRTSRMASSGKPTNEYPCRWSF